MTIQPSNYPTTKPALTLDFAKSKQLDPRITFSRSSSGTYVDANGVIQSAATNVARFDHAPATGESLGLLVEEARTNIQKYSTDFATQWTFGGTGTGALYPNVALAPDNTFTASKLAAENTRYLSSSGNGLSLASGWVAFNLATGSFVQSLGTVTSYGIVAVGNGWYRVHMVTGGYCASVYAKAAELSQIAIQLFNNSFYIYSSNGAAGNTTSGILIWGAQLEAGSFPTSYIPTPATFTSRASTATYYDANGVIQTAGSNVARSAAFFPDSSGVMRSAGLLLEAARTNKKVNSTTLNPSFIFTNTVSPAPTATIVAPDGVSQTVEILAEDTSTNLHSGSLQFSGTYSDWAVSFFVKAAGRTRFKFDPRENGTFREFDLTAGTVDGVVDPSKFEKLPNGWFRVKNMTVSNFRAYSRWRLLDASGNESYTGNGTSGIYLWGLQWEDSATFSSSYIPTTGSQVTRAADVSSSATVTRAADVVSMTGTNFSSWYNQSEGTLFAQWVSPDTKQFSSPAIIKESTAKNGPRIYNYAYTGNKIYALVKTTVGHEILLTSAYSPNTPLKTIIGYSASEVASTFNGNSTQTASITTAIPTMTRLDIGDVYAADDRYSNHHIARLTYWPTRLSNATLQAITR